MIVSRYTFLLGPLPKELCTQCKLAWTHIETHIGMCIHAYMGYTYSPYKVSDVGSVQISGPTFFSLESIVRRYPPKIIPLASRTNVSLSFSCIRPPRQCSGLTESERCLTPSGSSPSKRPVLPDYLHPQQPTTAERRPESLILTKQSPLFSLLSPLPSSRSLTSGAMLLAYPFSSQAWGSTSARPRAHQN